MGLPGGWEGVSGPFCRGFCQLAGGITVGEMEQKGVGIGLSRMGMKGGLRLRERYRSTHLDEGWLQQHGIDTGPAEDAMERFFETGILTGPDPPRAYARFDAQRRADRAGV